MSSAKSLLAAALVCLLASGCSPGPHFDAERITADVRMLASDDFAGRAPASPGETRTVNYLIEQLDAAGLAPGGDPQPDGTRAWTQDVPLVRSVIDGPVQVNVRTERGRLSWTQGKEIAIRAAQTGASHIDINGVPMVFVGYGVYAPERNWDDYKGIDLKGKVALFLVNDPDFETGQGDFGGKAMTYYGRWTYKYEEAARRGAVGALVIHETDPATYGWATVRNSNIGAMFDVMRENPLAVHVPVEGWIQRSTAGDLFARAGLDFETLKARARTRDFNPVILPGTRISIDFTVKRDKVVSKNVMAVLKGRSRPDQWVLYTSHWDHFGVMPGPKGRDSIYNGAVDNAAGVAQLLEIARNFADTGRTRRSVGFLFLTAEERGLLGSEYYATHPLYPLALTVADINTDAPHPTGPAWDFSTAGDAPSTLQDMLIDAGSKFGRRFTPDSNPQAGYFYRSDHFSFAKRGVPAISFRSGEDLKQGGTVAGREWDRIYRAKRYHQPGDEMGGDWRSDGLADDGLLLYSLGRQLANSRRWPTWKKGAEFKAVREATADQRK